MNGKQLLMMLLAIFILQITNAKAQIKLNGSDKILGVFWSPKKDAKIEIYKKGAFYYGKSIWVASPGKDSENPIGALQKRDILGIELLTNFKFNNGEYSGGRIYDPESGKTYDCKMSLIENKLQVRGFVGISLFGRTEIFERVATK
ncbi:DUF2147 domain-containing protein [Flavobacterium sp. XS2P12]|uniref:DUF2147 domain-containing protein n=1 Tax=Flavobacterium melibiosi TaxID=3398734 RepID=UPI003A87DA7D